MKRLYRTNGSALGALSLVVGWAGLAVIIWVLPEMAGPLLLALLLGWGAAVIGGVFLLRWRFAQRT